MQLLILLMLWRVHSTQFHSHNLIFFVHVPTLFPLVPLDWLNLTLSLSLFLSLSLSLSLSRPRSLCLYFSRSLAPVNSASPWIQIAMKMTTWLHTVCPWLAILPLEMQYNSACVLRSLCQLKFGLWSTGFDSLHQLCMCVCASLCCVFCSTRLCVDLVAVSVGVSFSLCHSSTNCHSIYCPCDPNDCHRNHMNSGLLQWIVSHCYATVKNNYSHIYIHTMF